MKTLLITLLLTIASTTGAYNLPTPPSYESTGFYNPTPTVTCRTYYNTTTCS